MKNLLSILLVSCTALLSLQFDTVCDPVRTPFHCVFNQFDPKTRIAVEGYFTSEIKFTVTKSSDAAVKAGNSYNVFEYGPFGSRCESYEMGMSVDSAMIGKTKQRLLIVYKARSINGKLVTEIFNGAGAEINKSQRVSSIDYRYAQDGYDKVEYSAPLALVRSSIVSGKTASMKWNVKNLGKY